MDEGRQIIAMGGVSPESVSALSRYVVEHARAPSPRLGFLPTATADSQQTIARFYEIFGDFDCRPSHFELFGRVKEPAAYLEAQDIVFVGGGNTKSMLGLWREWGLDTLLREAWESGVVLAGFSAGAICWFGEGLSDSWADRLAPTPGLGMLPGSCCPHYTREPERRPRYHELLLERAIAAGVAIDDDCAVHYRGTHPHRVVAVRPGAGAYRVHASDGSVVEEPIEAEPVLLPG